MGLETAPQQSLGRIDPSSIVAKADPNVVSPSAVAALTDAMRQGFLTAHDVIDRVGEHAKAKRKVEVQLLKEAGSPQAQQMRAAQMAQTTGAAQVGAAQAQGVLPQVPQQTAINQTAMDEAQARQKFGTGIDDFRALAPLVPGYTTPPTKPDGSLDYDLMGTEGNHLKSVYSQKLLAQDRLKATEHTETSGPGGVKGRTDYNAYKEDVSPGSEAFTRYSRAAQEPLSFKNWKPGTTMGATPAPVTPPTVTPAAPMVYPKQTVYGNDAQAAADAAQAAATGATATVTPKQPAPAPAMQSPMISPAAGRPGPGTYVPGMGVITGTGDTVKGAADARDQFAKDETYKQWAQSKQYANELRSVQDELSKISVEDQRTGKVNLNVKDVVIASSFIKLFDPSAVIREFKWDKLASSGSIPERIRNSITTVLHGGAFTPEVRQEVIKYGLGAFDSKQQAIIPLLDQARQIAEDNGYPIGHVLTSEEQKILQNSGATPTGVNSQPQSQGPVVTLSTGKKVMRGPDGKAYIAP
jgi:hypothetical protein